MIIQAMLLAGLGACALAVGTHLQHRGVALAAIGRTDAGPQSGAASESTSGPSLRRCLRTPTWVLGLLVIGAATAMNLVALALAPVALVQPLGVLSLICAALISTRTSGLRMTRGLVLGILACSLGVAGFVGVSALYSRTTRLADATVWELAALLGVGLAVGLVALLARARHLVLVAVSGLLFGLVAVSMHLVLPVIAGVLLKSAGPGSGSGPADPAAGVSLGAMLVVVALVSAAAGLGSWLVQTAYASGPPETVLAGLTVLDPMIAVLVGAILLGEYGGAGTAGTAAILASALLAVAGIVLVVRRHPGLGRPDAAVPHTAGTTPRGDDARAHTTQLARG